MEPLLNKLMRIINGWDEIYVRIGSRTCKMAELSDSEKARYIIAWLSPYLEVKDKQEGEA